MSTDRNEIAKEKLALHLCLNISIAFFFVYLIIHVLLNFAAEPFDYHNFTFHHFLKETSGPFTISICSSLLIFSFGSFIAQGMEHLSIAAPRAFFKAFTIFVAGQIVVQIAGHAEIFLLSENYKSANAFLRAVIPFLSFLAIPGAFVTLGVLENYQANIYRAVKDQLPNAALRHHANPAVLTIFTLLSVGLSFYKGFSGDYGLVLLAETLLAAGTVLLTFRPEIVPASLSSGRSEA